MKQEKNTATFFGQNPYRRRSTISAILIFSVLAIAVAVNALSGLLPHNLTKLKLSNREAYRVSGNTVDAMRALPEEDVTLYLICDGGRSVAENTDLYAFLLNYSDENERITVKVIDPITNSAWIDGYGGVWPADGSIVAESARRYLLIRNSDLFFYYSSAVGAMTTEELNMMLAYLSQNESDAAMLEEFTQGLRLYFNGESRVTNALQYVTAPTVPVLYQYIGAEASEFDRSLYDFLTDTCYDVRTVSSLASLPADCDLLVIHAPMVDLSTSEAAALSAYLSDGGKLFLSTLSDYATIQSGGEKTALPNLEAVLADYGMGTSDICHTVKDQNPNFTVSESAGYLFKTKITTHAATPDASNAAFVAAYPHVITLRETDGVTLTPWLTTSSAAYLSTCEDGKTWTDQEEKQSYTIGAIAEKGESAVVWISSPMSLNAAVNSGYAQEANYALFGEVLAWLTDGGQDAIILAASPIPTPVISASVTELFVWGAVLIILVPIATVSVGATVHYIRKKRV